MLGAIATLWEVLVAAYMAILTSSAALAGLGVALPWGASSGPGHPSRQVCERSWTRADCSTMSFGLSHLLGLSLGQSMGIDGDGKSGQIS